jgi:hypothetical protein
MRLCYSHVVVSALLAVGLAAAEVDTSTPSAPVVKAGISALTPLDRLEVREAQLTLAQARIAELQATARVRDAVDQLSQIVQSLQAEYACPGCDLNPSLFWVKPAPPAPPAPAPAPPPPAKAKE